MIIFCGHFPDGAMHFTEEEIEDETRAEWYLRQILGAANFKGGPLLHIMSGNLGFQIEHHLFPDLPSNRYAEISVKVQALCEKYDIPYTTGPLHQQYGQALRTIMKLSLPNGMTSSDTARAARPAGRPAAASPTPSGRPAAPSSAPGPAQTPGAEGRMTPVLHDLRDRRWVTRCALSRICGGCGTSLGRPIVFVGTPDEVGAQRLPPAADAPDVRRGAAPRRRGPTRAWELVTTSGFEFVRPDREDLDQEPRFEPNSLLRDGRGASAASV